MELTHWKKLLNPKYLGAYSFNPKEEKIVIIKNIKVESVINTDGKSEECIIAELEKEKPLILNRTNCKIIEKIYKTSFKEEWTGKAIQVYVTKVKAYGDIVDGLRIRSFIPKTQQVDIICSECKNKILDAVGKTAQWVAEYTKKQYGRELCNICATKLKEQIDSVANKESENE